MLHSFPTRRSSDLARERNGSGAAAAADIDDALTRLQLRPLDHEIGDRLEQHVLRRLPVRPALAGWPVPIGDLVGVLFVGGGRVHGCGNFRSVRLRSSSFGVTAFALHAPAGMPSRSAKREGW